MGDHEEALAHADAVIGLAPEHPTGYVRRIEVRQQLDDDEGIEEDCDLLASLEVENLVPQRARTRALTYLCKRPKKGLEAYQRLVESAPQWAAEKNAYAWALLTSEPVSLRDPVKALELATEATDLTDSRNAGYLDTLALAYHLTGDSAKAIEIERKAISLLPEDANRSAYEKNLAEFESALDDAK